MSLQRPSPRPANRTPPAMPAGSYPPHPSTQLTPPRSRKVKCNRLPGQEKVRIRATCPVASLSPLSYPQCQVRPIPHLPHRPISSPSSIANPKITPARWCHFAPRFDFPRSFLHAAIMSSRPPARRNAMQPSADPEASPPALGTCSLPLSLVFGCGCTSRTRADVHLCAQ